MLQDGAGNDAWLDARLALAVPSLRIMYGFYRAYLGFSSLFHYIRRR